MDVSGRRPFHSRGPVGSVANPRRDLFRLETPDPSWRRCNPRPCYRTRPILHRIYRSAKSCETRENVPKTLFARGSMLKLGKAPHKPAKEGSRVAAAKTF